MAPTTDKSNQGFNKDEAMMLFAHNNAKNRVGRRASAPSSVQRRRTYVPSVDYQLAVPGSKGNSLAKGPSWTSHQVRYDPCRMKI
jgi:hypothetical protein